jgi:hypothetical protein
MRAEADSGDITIAVPDLPYRVNANADSGDVEVRVRQSVDAPRRIEADAASGDVAILRLSDDD